MRSFKDKLDSVKEHMSVLQQKDTDKIIGLSVEVDEVNEHIIEFDDAYDVSCALMGVKSCRVVSSKDGETLIFTTQPDTDELRQV